MKNYYKTNMTGKINTDTVDKKDNGAAKNTADTVQQTYSYYSRVLKTPFDSLEELKNAEATHYAELKAKEDKAAQKKSDAQKVEGAFKALNAARKNYKEELEAITHEYSENLTRLKKSFEKAKAEVHESLAAAESNYSAALKEFTEKYPEGYHLTLKDGDFETTISSSHTATSGKSYHIADLFDWLLF